VQALLVREGLDVADRDRTVGDRDRHVDQDPTRIVTSAAFLQSVSGSASAAVRPIRSASSASSTVPACDTTPTPSQVMTGTVLPVVRRTCEVPLLSDLLVPQQDKNPSNDRHVRASTARVGPQDQTTTAAAGLETQGIGRRFGHVEALSGENFTVYPDEIVGLIGDNGAGKSTLTKILSGADEPSEGEIRVEGQVVRLTNPHVARYHGAESVGGRGDGPPERA